MRGQLLCLWSLTTLIAFGQQQGAQPPQADADQAVTRVPPVRPFVLRSAAQFRPPAPPALTSPKSVSYTHLTLPTICSV